MPAFRNVMALANADAAIVRRVVFGACEMRADSSGALVWQRLAALKIALEGGNYVFGEEGVAYLCTPRHHSLWIGSRILDNVH